MNVTFKLNVNVQDVDYQLARLRSRFAVLRAFDDSLRDHGYDPSRFQFDPIVVEDIWTVEQTPSEYWSL